MPMIVRAVLFDLDDTLFDHHYCSRAALQAVHASDSGLSAMPFDALERRHAEFLEQLHADVMIGRLAIDDARRERFRRLYGAAGVTPDEQMVAAAAQAYKQAYLTARRPMTGAAALLALVKTRARVGIVSNNLLDEQREKLRECGLDSLVDALVVSEELGISKPDPRIFQVALGRLGTAAGDAVMIGDSWAADVVGARACGIRAIWFNRHGARAPEAGVETIRGLEPVDAAMRIIFGSHRH